MFKFYFLGVTYDIAFSFIGVCLHKLVVNGDFIRLIFNKNTIYTFKIYNPTSKLHQTKIGI